MKVLQGDVTLGQAGRFLVLASTADPDEYNRWDGADSADVSEENNKDISSLVHSVKVSICLATVCHWTALEISVKLADYTPCQVQQVLRAIGVIGGGWKKCIEAFPNQIISFVGVCVFMHAQLSDI